MTATMLGENFNDIQIYVERKNKNLTLPSLGEP